MKYVTAGRTQFRADVIKAISGELDHDRTVTLFVSGGSAVVDEASILNSLAEHTRARNLTILPVDERFGIKGHADSNIAQLNNALGEKDANLAIVDILGTGSSAEATTEQYDEMVKHSLRTSDVTYAILGVGEDGHTAGILPGSKAYTSLNHVEYYASEPFTRITLTKAALCKISHVYTYAYGEQKQGIINELIQGSTGKPIDMFHEFPDTVLYTDNFVNHLQQQ